MSDSAESIIRGIAGAVPVFRSLPIHERIRLVKKHIHPRQAESRYRRVGCERWVSLGLPGTPSDHGLDWIESNVSPDMHSRAIACRVLGLCVVASNTYEVMSDGMDGMGHPLVRMQAGCMAKVPVHEETYHVWISSEGEGQVDATSEQLSEFIPHVRHDLGRPSGRRSLLFIQGAIPLPPPMSRYRISKVYLPTFEGLLKDLTGM